MTAAAEDYCGAQWQIFHERKRKRKRRERPGRVGRVLVAAFLFEREKKKEKEVGGERKRMAGPAESFWVAQRQDDNDWKRNDRDANDWKRTPEHGKL